MLDGLGLVLSHELIGGTGQLEVHLSNLLGRKLHHSKFVLNEQLLLPKGLQFTVLGEAISQMLPGHVVLSRGETCFEVGRGSGWRVYRLRQSDYKVLVLDRGLVELE